LFRATRKSLDVQRALAKTVAQPDTTIQGSFTSVPNRSGSVTSPFLGDDDNVELDEIE